MCACAFVFVFEPSITKIEDELWKLLNEWNKKEEKSRLLELSDSSFRMDCNGKVEVAIEVFSYQLMSFDARSALWLASVVNFKQCKLSGRPD